jgi:hypothetical protein
MVDPYEVRFGTSHRALHHQQRPVPSVPPSGEYIEFHALTALECQSVAREREPAVWAVETNVTPAVLVRSYLGNSSR